MPGEPAAAEAGVKLQLCVLLGKLSLDHRTPAVVGCTGSQEEVWIVTCARTRASWWLWQQP